MRLSQVFAPTLKETPKEAEVASHKLLLRAGYIRKLAAGIYNFLPLGIRAVRKVETIVREEMNRAGAQEVLMPAVQPASIWKESGRWDFYGKELLRFNDRKGGDFCFGPTHEEVVTDMVRGEVRSYRQLPLNLYQVQSKFRDELRPRAGLMRGREFIMKDAYSFDVDQDAGRESYDAMFRAYERIFTRCGLTFRPVEADTGNIGGNMSHEFQVLADSGEDAIVSCSSCGYTANVEKAEIRSDQGGLAEPSAELSTHETPNVRTVEQVAAFFDSPTTRVVKTILFMADDAAVAVLMRGDLVLNEVKLKSVLGAGTLHLANDRTVEQLTGAPVGFAGPVGLKARILVDDSVRGIADGIIGANALDTHYTGFSVSRDVQNPEFVDLRIAKAGDPCGRCEGTFESFRGIEVGHVFMLGTKYSEALGATFLDKEGAETPMFMGCYGIGVTRVLSAAIEQHHDEHGIVWPMSLAPFQAVVVPLQVDDETVMGEANRIYRELNEQGIEVLIDDRDMRPGAKFKDSELLGTPLRVTVSSRGLEKGIVELKRRGADGREDVAPDTVVSEVVSRVAAELAADRA